MHLLHTRISLLFLGFLNILNAQTTPISGIINHYAAVSAIDTCTGQLSVSDTTGFRVGSAVLLIQMQGASIFTPNDATYGHIQNLNEAGLYERATIDSVGTGVLFLKKRLRNTYNISGVLQVLTFPEYLNAMVTDTLRPKPWDGNTGGVLAFRVTGTLTLDAPIFADGAGFRGGAAFPGPANNCSFLVPQTSYFYESGNWRSANKGEGVTVRETGKELGRGPQANGGGGGNDHNAGGGGGGNILMGGRGGDNDEPGFLNCQGYYPGLGGRGLGVSADRIFLGGGGGAGHANNGFTNSGGNGGGIILIQAASIDGNLPFISANGIDATTANGDGGGGGGAGGTIRLETNSATPGLIVRANGGKGGDTENNGQNRCFGPGGGGSGGDIWSNVAGIATPTGGEPGIVTGSSNACNGASNNAMAGDPGLLFPLSNLPEDTLLAYVPEIFADPKPETVCEGEPASFTVSTNFGNWLYQWQLDDGSGWQNISGGQGFTGFQSDSLVLEHAALPQNTYLFRCVITRTGCSEIGSNHADLSVVAFPTADFNTLMNSHTVDFINLSSAATTIFWDFGDSTGSNETNPVHTFLDEGPYTIILYAANACDTVTATQTILFELPPVAGFQAPDSTLDCQVVNIDFANTSSPNATSFEWNFPGGNPSNSNLENPTVTYLNSGTYTAQLIASNAIGADTFAQTFFVQVLDFPIAAFSYSAGANNLVQFTNLSQGGDVYIWDFGDGSPTDTVFSPSHTYAQAGIYTITLLVTNSCGGAALQQMVNTVPVGTSEMLKFGQIRLFPNPAGGILNVDCGLQPVELQVFNQNGQLVLSKKQGLGLQTVLSLQDLPTGIYALQIRFEGGAMMRKFVKM